jgi:capsule synthesis protein PGA_cap
MTRIERIYTDNSIGSKLKNLLLENVIGSHENRTVDQKKDNSAGQISPGQVAGTGRIRLAAVGDLLLSTDPCGEIRPRDGEKLFSEVTPILAQSDVVFGNLECTLCGNGDTVPTEPRVITSEELIRSVKAAGIGVVTLANNHAFDCLLEGFHRTRSLLDEIGISSFGAGDTQANATAPIILEAKGIRLGFIGAVDRQTGAGPMAEPDSYGVAPLDIERMTAQIRELRNKVDHVIVSVHWGEERFQIPAPNQIEQAHRLVHAGASLVLGHHPHVLQGLERYQGAIIIYSLGNFTANDVYYTDGDRLTWNRTERTGCILQVEMDSKTICGIEQILTCDSGRTIEIDPSRFGSKLSARLNRSVARGVTLRRYRWEHLRIKILKSVLEHFRWRHLKRLRVRQIGKAFSALFLAARVK